MHWRWLTWCEVVPNNLEPEMQPPQYSDHDHKAIWGEPFGLCNRLPEKFLTEWVTINVTHLMGDLHWVTYIYCLNLSHWWTFSLYNVILFKSWQFSILHNSHIHNLIAWLWCPLHSWYLLVSNCNFGIYDYERSLVSISMFILQHMTIACPTGLGLPQAVSALWYFAQAVEYVFSYTVRGVTENPHCIILQVFPHSTRLIMRLYHHFTIFTIFTMSGHFLAFEAHWWFSITSLSLLHWFSEGFPSLHGTNG